MIRPEPRETRPVLPEITLRVNQEERKTTIDIEPFVLPDKEPSFFDKAKRWLAKGALTIGVKLLLTASGVGSNNETKEEKTNMENKSIWVTIAKVVTTVAGLIGVQVDTPTSIEGSTDIALIVMVVYAVLGAVEKFFIKKEVKS